MVECGLRCRNRDLRCYDCRRNKNITGRTIDYLVPYAHEVAMCSTCGKDFEKVGMFTKCPKCLNDKFNELRGELDGTIQ